MVFSGIQKSEILAAFALLTGLISALFVTGSGTPVFAPCIISIFIFAALVLLPGFKDGWAVPKTPPVLFIALFWLWMIVSVSWSTVPYISILFCYILSLLPLCALTLILAPGERERKAAFFLAAMAPVWIIISLWALVQFTLFFLQYGPRIAHPMLNPNNMAAFLNLGLLPAIGLYFTVEKRRHQVLTGLAMALIYAALLTTQSRGGLLSSAISLLVLLPFAVVKKPFPWKRGMVFIYFLVLMPIGLNFYQGERLYEPALNSLHTVQVKLSQVKEEMLAPERPAIESPLAKTKEAVPKLRKPDAQAAIKTNPPKEDQPKAKQKAAKPQEKTATPSPAKPPAPAQTQAQEGERQETAEEAPAPKKDTGLLALSDITDMASTHNRIDIWKSTWEMLKDHPLKGIGLATFYYYFPAYRRPADTSDGFFAHMDPIQFWLEMSIISPLLFYGILITVLLRTFSAVRNSWHDPALRMKVMAPFCGMLAVTGHTHISFHLYLPGIIIPLGCLLGYWYVVTERILQDESARIGPLAITGKVRPAALAGSLIFLALLLSWPLRAGLSVYYLNKAYQYGAEGNIDRTAKAMDAIALIRPASYERYYDYRAKLTIQKLRSNKDNLSSKEIQALFDEALSYIEEATKRNPVFSDIWSLRATLYLSVDNLLFPDGKEKAIPYLQKALELNPLAIKVRLKLAQIYKQEGRLQDAMDLLDNGLKWPRPRGELDVRYLLETASMKRITGDANAYEVLVREAVTRAQIYEARFGTKIVVTPDRSSKDLRSY